MRTRRCWRRTWKTARGTLLVGFAYVIGIIRNANVSLDSLHHDSDLSIVAVANARQPVYCHKGHIESAIPKPSPLFR